MVWNFLTLKCTIFFFVSKIYINFRENFITQLKLWKENETFIFLLKRKLLSYVAYLLKWVENYNVVEFGMVLKTIFIIIEVKKHVLFCARHLDKYNYGFCIYSLLAFWFNQWSTNDLRSLSSTACQNIIYFLFLVYLVFLSLVFLP